MFQSIAPLNYAMNVEGKYEKKKQLYNFHENCSRSSIIWLKYQINHAIFFLNFYVVIRLVYLSYKKVKSGSKHMWPSAFLQPAPPPE